MQSSKQQFKTREAGQVMASVAVALAINAGVAVLMSQSMTLEPGARKVMALGELPTVYVQAARREMAACPPRAKKV